MFPLVIQLGLLYLFSNLCPLGQFATSTIATQQEFDEVISKINRGDTVYVNLLPGRYNLTQPVMASAPLTMVGDKAVISSHMDSYSLRDLVNETATHYLCKLKNSLNVFSLMLDQNWNQVYVSESVDDICLVNKASSIEGSNDPKSGQTVALPIPGYLNHLKNKTFDKSFGYFDCGWANINFSLESSDSSHFFCKTLHSTNVPRFDYEKSTYKNNIRFVIYNAEIKPDAVYYDNEYIYIPKKISNLYVKNCNAFDGSFHELTVNGDLFIRGVEFVGVENIIINSEPSAKCFISRCIFKKTLGNTLTINKKSNRINNPVHISGCKFEECSLLRGKVLDINGSCDNETDIYVKDSEFVRYPDNIIRYKNTFALVNVNADANISGCTLWNTCRCHLYFTRGNSVSEGNVIYNTREFNSVKDRNLSNDWGLIYVNHVFKDKDRAISNIVHKILIQECYLHGAYAHAGDARGVMVDNGRGDVTCRNNVVLDCQSFSLDARDAKSFVSFSSIRNVFEENLLGCKYRLAGGIDVPEEYRPISKDNVLLSVYKNVFNDYLHIESKDTVFPIQIWCENDKAFVNKTGYKKLKDVPFFFKIDKLIDSREK